MGKQPQLPGSRAKDVMCKRWDTPEKICPRIGQSVTAMGQDKAILILFVLSSQDVSLMSSIRPSFWSLPNM